MSTELETQTHEVVLGWLTRMLLHLHRFVLDDQPVFGKLVEN